MQHPLQKFIDSGDASYERARAALEEARIDRLKREIETAIRGLMSLGLKWKESYELVNRTMCDHPSIHTAEELVKEALRSR